MGIFGTLDLINKPTEENPREKSESPAINMEAELEFPR